MYARTSQGFLSCFSVRWWFLWAACCGLLWAAGCQKQDTLSATGAGLGKAAAGVVKVYTHRHYPTDKALFARFEKETGIKVEVVQNAADALIKRIELQGKNTDADVLITVDAGRLVRAQQKGLLQPIKSKVLEANIPSPLRDPKGHWFGLTRRARVIVYAKDRVKAADLPTYESLAESRWKGKILIRSSNNIYNQSLLASLIAHHGKEKALAWAKGVVANMARTPKGSDRGQMKAIAGGEGDIAVVNTYYIGLMQTSESEKDRKLASMLGVIFPNQGDRGAHVNISGAGVVRHARNKAHAVRFVEYLSSPAAQQMFAQANHEYPVHPSVQPSKLVASWGDFRADTIHLFQLGDKNSQAVEVFDQAGWR